MKKNIYFNVGERYTHGRSLQFRKHSKAVAKSQPKKFRIKIDFFKPDFVFQALFANCLPQFYLELEWWSYPRRRPHIKGWGCSTETLIWIKPLKQTNHGVTKDFFDPEKRNEKLQGTAETPNMLKWFHFSSRNREEKAVLFFVRGEALFAYKRFLVYLFFLGIFGFLFYFIELLLWVTLLRKRNRRKKKPLNLLFRKAKNCFMRPCWHNFTDMLVDTATNYLFKKMKSLFKMSTGKAHLRGLTECQAVFAAYLFTECR